MVGKAESLFILQTCTEWDAHLDTFGMINVYNPHYQFLHKIDTEHDMVEDTFHLIE